MAGKDVGEAASGTFNGTRAYGGTMADLAMRAGVTMSKQQQRDSEEQLRVVETYYRPGKHYVLNYRHKPFFLVEAKGALRNRLFSIIDSSGFTALIAFFITLNVALTIVDTPGIRERSGVKTTLLAFDIILQVVFTLEIVAKMLALGVILHRHSFFRSPQNWVDFVAVIAGFVVFGVDSDVVERLVRLLRSTRALGYLTRFALLRAIFIALKNSAKKLRNVMLLMSFVIVGMAVLGLDVFVGTFQQKCYYDITTNTTSNETQKFLDPAVSDMRCSLNPNSGHECTNPGTACEEHPGIFHSYYLTYDHIGEATFLVFKMVTMDNWPADLKIIQEANGVTWFLYTFVIILFGSFFAMNLVLAILSSEYEEASNSQQEREQALQERRDHWAKKIEAERRQERVAQGLSMEDAEMSMAERARVSAEQLARDAMAQAQAVYLSEKDAKKQLDRSFAGTEIDSDGNSIHDADSDADPTVIVTEASADGAEASAAREPKPSRRRRAVTGFKAFRGLVWTYVVDTLWFQGLSLAVTVINVLVLATDHHGIDERWQRVNNWINFACSIYFIVEAVLKILAMASRYFRDPFNDFDLLLCIVSIPEMVLAGTGDGSSLSALRAFRLARLMRLVNSSKRVKTLLITVGNAGFESATLFLFLFAYVALCALFCVIAFPNSVPEDERPNYTNYAESLLANFIVISGESWVDEAVKVMHGSSVYAAAYFILYFIMGNYVILNFVVVILIRGYTIAAEQLLEEQEREDMAAALPGRREGAAEDEGDIIPFSTVGPHQTPKGKDGADDSEVSPAQDTTPDRGVTKVAVGGNGHDASPEAPPRSPRDDQDDDHLNAQRRPSDQGSERHFRTEEELEARRQATGVRSAPASRPTSARQRADFDEEKRRNEEAAAAVLHGDDDAPAASGEAEHAEFDTTQSKKKTDVDMKKLRSLREFKLREYLAGVFGMDVDPLKNVEGNSFKVFSPENPFRRLCAMIVNSPYYEVIALLAIVLSCIALALDNAEARKDEDFRRLLDFNTIFMFVFFLIEMLLKWVAFGVVLGEHAYFRSPWNVSDFIILVFSFIALFVELQAAQALRIFRVASKWHSLRTVIVSLAYAVPSIANVAFLVAFFFLVAGILGVQIWKGRFVSCSDESVELKAECYGLFNSTEVVVVDRGGQYVLDTETTTSTRYWLHSFYNFNHLGEAALSLLVIMYGDGWSGVLYNAMDVRSADLAMAPNDSWWWAIVVVIFLVLGNFFLNNLFVGSLMDSFKAERQRSQGKVKDDGHKLLSDEQERWIREYRFAMATKLPKVVPKPGNPLRSAMVRLYFADRKKRVEPRTGFDILITIIILLNAFVLCLRHHEQPQGLTDFLFWSNVFFAVAFTIEFLIKVVAMLPPAYFDDPWNRFDFLLLIFAWVGIFFADTPGTNALRVARVARVLRLVKKARGLYQLFQTLVYALPQLVNVSIILFLVMYVFGVTGTQLFQHLYFDDSDDTVLGRFFNFKEVWRSMMLLFQIGTGEAWADVLAEANINERNSGCSEADGTCGTAWSYPFFILFMLCANSVAINLFIFIVVDNYEEVSQINANLSQYLLHRLSRFRLAWANLDTDRTEQIRWTAFVAIVRHMQLYASDEWEEFIDDFGDQDEFFADADGDGVEDDSASDVSDAPAKENLDDRRPTTADFREHGMQTILNRVMRRNDFDESAAEDGVLQANNRGVRSDELTDRYFLMKVAAMQVPVSDDGMVLYEDCVMGLIREFYSIAEEEIDAMPERREFINSLVDYNPEQVFMVHHALAITKITRAFKHRKLSRLSGRKAKGLGEVPEPGAEDEKARDEKPAVASSSAQPDSKPSDKGVTERAADQMREVQSRVLSTVQRAINAGDEGDEDAPPRQTPPPEEEPHIKGARRPSKAA